MRYQHQHFIDTQLKDIVALNDELHKLYDNANDLYQFIAEYKDYLKYIGIDYDKIEKLNDRIPINSFEVKSRNFDDEMEHQLLKANLNAYVNILTNKIPAIQEEIDFKTYMAHISFESFMDIYSSLNTEISRILILGDRYYFPGKLGGIEILTYDRNFNKQVPDYGKSNKLKKEGHEHYMVFRTDDTYCTPVFLKENSYVKNYKYYRFKFTKFINTKERSQEQYYKDMDVDNVDSIIYDTRVGNWEKMLAIKKIYGEQIYTHHDNKLRKSEAYNRKYIR